MPNQNALNDAPAAFGFFPHLKRNRTVQDPEAAKDMPLQFGMGRGAATLGLPADIANIFRSPSPTEMFGETNYDAPAQFNWTTQHFQKTRPLQPTSPAGAAASSAGALLPLSPAEALQAARLARIAAVKAGRGGKAVLNMAGEELANRMLSGRSTIPGVPSAFAPSPLKFAVEPGGPRQELTNQMRELLAQRKLLQAGPEMNALNLELTSLQQQFKEMPAVQRVAKEVVAPQVTAPVSNIGFYSAAEQASSNLARQSGTGEAFLNDLMKVPDVKKEELAWTGLDDFLRGKQNVTKQEVQDFIAANKVDVQEVMLGGNEAPSQDLLNWMSARNISQPRNPEGWQELSQKLESYAQRDQAQGRLPQTSQRYFTLSEEASRISEGLDVTGSARGATKHERWQLPGGENYREILLTLPFKEPAMPKGYQVTPMQYDDGTIKYFAETPTSRSQGFRTQEEAQEQLLKTANNLKGFRENLESYKSSHFNEPNILAHMRVNDRIDAEGKKMLLIEEVQSDWHQAGRKGGYRVDAELDKKLAELTQQHRKVVQDRADIVAVTGKEDEYLKLSKQENQILAEMNKLHDTKQYGPPDAPFKDTWHQVALKRALKYAADNGYERVGLTTGKQQIERYSDQLRQNVSQIEFQTGTKLSPSEASELQALRDKPHSEMRGNDRARMNYLSDNEGMFVKPNETRINAFNGSRPAFSGTVANGKFLDGPAQGKTVEEVLGSSIAKQIAEKPSGTISGENLSVGGEGMKKYYDEIYPAFLDKQSKKWNAKTGETTIGKKGTTEKAGVNYYQTPDTSAKVRYIDITPEMKGALAQGQPLHGLIPAIPAAGFGVEGMNKQQNSLAPPTNNALFLSGAGP